MEIFRTFLSMHVLQKNQWTDTAHIIPGSTVRTWLRLFAKLKRRSLGVFFNVWTFCERSMNGYSNIISGRTVRTWLRSFAKPPAPSYGLCWYHVPRGLKTFLRLILGSHTCLILCGTHICSLRLFLHKPWSKILFFMHERSANNQWIDTAHIIPDTQCCSGQRGSI